MRALMILLCALPMAANGQQASLRVVMILEQARLGGTLHVALCPDRDAYISGEGCIIRTVVAEGHTATCDMDSLSTGTWAIKVFQDTNADGKLNRSWLGWPKEPVGYGNDAPVNTGPPFHLAAVKFAPGRNTARVLVR